MTRQFVRGVSVVGRGVCGSGGYDYMNRTSRGDTNGHEVKRSAT